MSANPGILPSWRSPVLLEFCVISLLPKLYKLLTITQVYSYKSVNLLHTYLSISGLPVQVQYMSERTVNSPYRAPPNKRAAVPGCVNSPSPCFFVDDRLTFKTLATISQNLPSLGGGSGCQRQPLPPLIIIIIIRGGFYFLEVPYRSSKSSCQ